MSIKGYILKGQGALICCDTCKSYQVFKCCYNGHESEQAESNGWCPRWKKLPDDNDVVNHPKHYTKHPSGVECIEITEHMGFNLGNAIKYIWRADLKEKALEDLEKAKWYISREIERLTKEQPCQN